MIQSVFSDYSRIGYLSNVLCFPVGCSPAEFFRASTLIPVVVSPMFPLLGGICGYIPFIPQARVVGLLPSIR